MSYIQIHCGRCGKSWEIYETTDWTYSLANVCPHCYAEIDPGTFKDQVIPAFGMVADANRELYKDHDQYGKDLFRINVISDQIDDRILRLKE